MQAGTPSRTALGAASHRAAHQILEAGSIFADPLALRILGEDGDNAVRRAEEVQLGAECGSLSQFGRASPRMRSRPQSSAVSVSWWCWARGWTPMRIVGIPRPLRIFEVDHPATQEWKRQRLAVAKIAIPENLAFAPVDFEHQGLADGLAPAGFDPALPTFFTWLGVVPYLTAEATWSTLAFIAGLPNGAHVVFDYSDPPATLSPEMRSVHEERAARVASLGEAWVNYFEAEPLRAKLTQLGFSEVEDLGPREIRSRYFPQHANDGRDKGGHVVRAAQNPS